MLIIFVAIILNQLYREWLDIKEDMTEFVMDCFKREDPMFEPLTISCEDAAARHLGQTARNIAKMCLRGQTLAKRHGGPSRVPAKLAANVIFARKVGRGWSIPVTELDRIFLPSDIHQR